MTGLNYRPDPARPSTDFHEWFNDFDDYGAADWVLTTTEAGSGSATEAVGSIKDGILVVTNDNADDDNDFFQWSGRDGSGTAETFKFVAGKSLYFGARLKISDATQADLVVGLQITDTSPLAVTDGIFFQKDDGDTHLDFHCEKNSTSSDLTDAAELASDTWTVLEFLYDGGDSIVAYKDGVAIGSVPLTNVPDDEELTISFGIQNGEAASKVLSVDWIRVVQERG
jgi:hypothetical protein